MSNLINTIRIERIELKSRIKTYKILINRKTVQDHFQDALADVEGRNLSWSSKNQVIVDGLKLLESGNASGQYAIFNCTCGSGAECVDLEAEVDVVHENDFIVWKYYAPRYKGKRSSKVFKFKFHKPQYLKELKKIEPINDLKMLPGFRLV